MPHRRPALGHAAAHAPTPLVEPKITKEEFAEFFTPDVMHGPDAKKVAKMLANLPPPSYDEIKAIGYFMGGSNLACIRNEKALIQRCGNDFKKYEGEVDGILSGWCESDSVYRGAMAEVKDWTKEAAKGDPITIYMWHNARLLAGVYPPYFK